MVGHFNLNTLMQMVLENIYQTLGLRRVLLLPLVIRDRSIGLFYLELVPGTTLDEKVLKAVKALRNQAALAIQQARNA